MSMKHNGISTALSFSLAALAFVGCGSQQDQASQTKVYGGVKTNPGDWQSTVGLASNGRLFCSGTAVHPKLVVTAAHCVQGISVPSRISVYVGEGIEGGRVETQHTAVKVAYSPKFGRNASGWNDIAYVVVDKPFDLPTSAYVPVLTDAEEIAQLLQIDNASHIVGFGNRNGGGFGVKYEVDAVITKVGDNEVAIGNNGKDSCQGDSGGPAYAQLKNGAWRVFGVVSRGGACGTGGIYGRMDANICWVQEDSGIDLGLSAYCAAKPAPTPEPTPATPVGI